MPWQPGAWPLVPALNGIGHAVQQIDLPLPKRSAAIIPPCLIIPPASRPGHLVIHAPLAAAPAAGAHARWDLVHLHI